MAGSRPLGLMARNSGVRAAGGADLGRNVLVRESELLCEPERAERARASDAVDAEHAADGIRCDDASCKQKPPQGLLRRRIISGVKRSLNEAGKTCPWLARQRPTLPSLET